jgi:sulfite reductase alpha subunit-like flavoprotein
MSFSIFRSMICANWGWQCKPSRMTSTELKRTMIPSKEGLISVTMGYFAEESVMNSNTGQANFSNQQPPEPQTVDAAMAQSLTEAQTSLKIAHRGIVPDVALHGATTSFKGGSVLILYGTATGNSELLAKKLAEALRQTGLTARVRDMARCQVSVLTQANCVLVVTSTYGDGEPPDAAAAFWQAIVHGHGLDLRGLKFSVLALGNTTYDHFCKCGRDFDAALERHGALRIYPRVDCDVDYETPARHWFDGVLASLRHQDGATSST